ncbi:MAG: DUF308 domain-containing protein [Clostridia bacterium]|nr:DUF308 domain-containing protein [Clostridia bacterium]
MKSIIKEFTTSVIVLSILAILLGIVLIAYPGVSLVALGITVAAYLIVHGITLIILDIKARHLYIPFNGLLRGIVCVILGILLAKYPGDIAVYIGIAVGLWIIVSSIDGIRFAAALKGTGAPWVLMIIINVIDIIIGCLVIYSPILSSLSLTVCIGIILIVHSIINIIDMIIVKKNVREAEKLVVEK